MATEAQVAANRLNAQSSTGAVSAAGKARSSSNATTSGLFTARNCVQPHEREEYDNLHSALWQDLAPCGSVEEMFAIEIVRGAWRLRRCADAETTLGRQCEKTARKGHEFRHGPDVPFRGACDPQTYEHSEATQVAIDRSRAQAHNAVRRATAELRRLQTERLLRTAVLGLPNEACHPGLASLAEILPKLSEAQQTGLKASLHAATPAPVPEAVPAPAPETEITKPTQSDPPSDPATARNAFCPCGSRLKYKRCCGPNAPAILQAAA